MWDLVKSKADVKVEMHYIGDVSKDENDNFLADLEVPPEESDYISILADLQTGETRPN